MLLIDGVPAVKLAARMIELGLAKPPHHADEMPASERRELVRRRTRECMQRLRARRKAEREAAQAAATLTSATLEAALI